MRRGGTANEQTVQHLGVAGDVGEIATCHARGGTKGTGHVSASGFGQIGPADDDLQRLGKTRDIWLG